nr:DinB family protein [Gracilibacillus ureilyticus]
MNVLYLIKDIDGFTRDISHLVSMMTWARATTLETVNGLSMEQLDFLVDKNSNSIGALLSHVAAVETLYQVVTFENRYFNEEEMKLWGTGLELGGKARKEIIGYSIDHYLTILKDVRQTTLNGLNERNDEWLYEETNWWRDKPANNYFKWFHVYEDEINHRGQMRVIKKLCNN